MNTPLMKYYLLILFLCAGMISAQGQKPDTLNRTNKEGLMTGYWIKYHPNGNKKYEGYFQQGAPSGILRRYYPDGKLQSVSDYSYPGDTVLVEMHYENGRKAARGKYLNRKKTGRWVYYSFWSDNYRVLEEQYRNDLKNGVSRKYHKNGNLAEIIHWDKGIKNGIWQQYYENGTLCLEARYEWGELHGKYLVNHRDGSRNVTGKYRNDLKHGTWIFYDQEGNTRSVHYTNGLAENQEELDSLHQKLLDDLEKNKGLIKDPARGEIEW